MILAGAMEVALDKLGRILVPDYLKDYAGLKKNVVICGLSNRFFTSCTITFCFLFFFSSFLRSSLRCASAGFNSFLF